MFLFNNFSVLLYVIFILKEIASSNVTSTRNYDLFRRAQSENIRSRQPKLLSFTNDGDLKLDLDFNVPFITIPIKKSMDMARSSLINMNVGALILGGVILFGAAVAFPLILALFNKKGLIPADNPLNSIYSRMEGKRGVDSNLWRYLSDLDDSLLSSGIDLTSCSQRFLCSAVKKSSENVAKGKGSSSDKILDGIMSNHWIQENVLNSLFNQAVKLGLENRNCASTFEKCLINYDSLYYFSMRLLNSFN